MYQGLEALYIIKWTYTNKQCKISNCCNTGGNTVIKKYKHTIQNKQLLVIRVVTLINKHKHTMQNNHTRHRARSYRCQQEHRGELSTTIQKAKQTRLLELYTGIACE